MIQRHEGWMFLSHSSKDFELVRKIRNTLEEHGFRPITFFLKCITDGDELDGLIKREIKARRWFVFVDSENSRSSEWAQAELAYARELNKNIYTIDSTQDYLPQLQNILQRTTVFLSCSHRDKDLAAKIRQVLTENDFQVWWGEDVRPGMLWPGEIANQIKTAGFCLLLVSQNALQSEYVMNEIQYALCQNRPVIPVLIGEHSLPLGMEFHFSHIQWLKLSESPATEELNRMIEDIIEYQERNDI